MAGLLGKKIGMTSMYNEDGKNIPCTVVELGPCVVTQIKTEATDGYEAIQLAYDEVKEKSLTKAEIGHFKKAKANPMRKVSEFGADFQEAKLGDTITAEKVFEVGDWVDVIALSKGKGFQGVVKRHGFSGVGGATHGQHNRLRAPGSVGSSSTPSRVFKGIRMAGRTGGNRVKVSNLLVMKVYPEQNLIVLKGAIPGHNGAYVKVEK